MSDTDALLFDAADGFGCKVANRTNAEDGDVVALVQAATLADREFFEGAAPIYQFATATGVTDGKGPLVGQLSGIHEVAQFVLIVGGCNGEVGYGA